MNVSFKFDDREFQKALRQHLLTTSRELADALNSRMFFLLVRFFVLCPPRSVQQYRYKVREYLNEPVEAQARISRKTGKRVSKLRTFRRVHKIVQAAQAKAGNKGLYGADMKNAAAAFRRRAIGSVGYMKASIVKALKQINGHFTQYGRDGKKAFPMNGALMRVTREYGQNADVNVGIFKGSKAYSENAKPGLNPRVYFHLNVAVKNDQFGRVAERMSGAFAQALRDETSEIQRHLQRAAQFAADQHNAK